jgi:hypothetical protein
MESNIPGVIIVVIVMLIMLACICGNQHSEA